MLLTLLKHEYKYIIKSFSIVYALFFIITIVFKILLHMAIAEDGEFSNSFMATLFWIFAISWYVFLFIIGLLTITNNSRRFKKSMFGPEGYLTNTLPVTTSSNIIAKIIAGATNYIVSYIAVALSVNILVVGIKGSSKAMKLVREGIGELFADHFDLVFAFFFCSLFTYLAFLLFCYMLSAFSSMIGGSKVKSFFIGLGLIVANIFIFSAIITALDDSTAVGSMFAVGFYYMILAAVEFLVVHNIVKNHLNLQ